MLPNNKQVKKAMAAYARKQKPQIKIGPGFSIANFAWGPAARTPAWRITRREKSVKTSTKKTAELVELIGLQVPLVVIEHNWNWRGSLGRRAGKPPFIIVHNQGGTGTPEAIHAYHRSIGYVGIAYHYAVTLKGTIHRGRPEWAMGGHTKHYNHCIGVMFEGNYDIRKSMPKVQLESGQRLIKDLKKRYEVPVRGHREMPLNSTSCPGKHFPIGKFR